MNEEIYALRGATTVDDDFPAEVDKVVTELMERIYEENGLTDEDISFVLFSQTNDIRSRNAAAAFRIGCGADGIPLFCVQEAEIAGGLPHCIRVLVQVNHRREKEPRYVYLRGAGSLRPDLDRH